MVEVVSPGSVRTDHVQERSEYADAGIPHHWTVDPAEPVSLPACHRAGGFGYVDDGAVTGTFTAVEPFPVEIDLEAPRRPRGHPAFCCRYLQSGLQFLVSGASTGSPSGTGR